MIISVSAGEGFEAPCNADFTLRFASPFTSGELLSGILTVECSGRSGVVSVENAVADGTDILLHVTPSMFSVGLWELNPVAFVAGKRRVFAQAVGMNILARGVSRYPSSRSNRRTSPQ